MPSDQASATGPGVADQAWSLLAALRFEDFVSTLSTAIEERPEAPEALTLSTMLANFLVGRGQNQEAIAYLKQGVARAPDRIDVRFQLARVLADQWQFAEAVEVLDDLPAPGPADEQRATARYLQGLYLHSQGRPEQALARYDQALAIAPRHRLIQYRRRRLLESLNRPGPSGLSLLEQASEPVRYAQYRGAADLGGRIHDPSYGDIAGQHAKLYHGDVADGSFLILDQDRVVAQVDCCVHQGRLSRFSRPIHVLIAPETAADRRFAIVEAAFDALIAILIAHGGHGLVVGDQPGGIVSQWIQQRYRGGRALPTDITHLTVDLGRSEAEIWAAVRKSYRPLINAAKKVLTLETMTGSNVDHALVEQFRQVHLAYRGPGYDAFFKAEPLLVQQVAAGRAELTIGSIAGRGPVSASLFVDHPPTTTYWAGRYLRTERGGFSHYPLYDAILRSRNRGMTTFYLGYLGGWEAQDRRLASIAFFKRGFANAVYSQPVWYLTRNR